MEGCKYKLFGREWYKMKIEEKGGNEVREIIDFMK